MTFKRVGNWAHLEEGGLTVKINYDAVMARIDDEINNSYIYSVKDKQDEYDGYDLYFFKRKGITKDNYIESLIEIKNLIDKMFTDVPTFNIFNFIPVTKKGKFMKNRVVNLAAPVVGLLFNYDYYKYIEYFCLSTEVQDENTVIVNWHMAQSDFNKFEPIFFVDYNTPVIKEKLSAIKKADLKVGMLYSDENHKKFFLYLGIAKTSYSSVIKQSKTLLSVDDFSEDEILNDIQARIKEKEQNAKKYGYSYSPYEYLFIRLTKKEYEKLIKVGSADFETFVNDCIFNNAYYVSRYDKPIRVFHEEGQYLTDIKNYSKIAKVSTHFIDNVSGPCFYGSLPKDTFTSCQYNYIDYN